MKIVTINGQNHKGSTYHIGRILADKIGGEITEIFLPKDFDKFCVG
ncbi:MAG: flavin reductase, partial [Acutalibacteraceae bacterium]|nr:flavin reductase [Acutalibacteraceae bacterium]